MVLESKGTRYLEDFGRLLGCLAGSDRFTIRDRKLVDLTYKKGTYIQPTKKIGVKSPSDPKSQQDMGVSKK